ncbi:hypothetical protein D3C77_402250 [compost metagenome]
MPTENRSSNTVQMVSVPRELLESIANPRNGFALGDSREQLRDLLAQPAAQHQGEPVGCRWEQLGGNGWCYGDKLPAFIIGSWQELFTHPPTSDGFSAGDMADQGAKAFRDGQRAIVLPERMNDQDAVQKLLGRFGVYGRVPADVATDIYNAALDEVRRLNEASISPE